jgi:hypothetical protein
MIDLTQYKLRYVCKKSKREFPGKTLGYAQDVVVIDPDTSEKKVYSRSKLRRLFTCQKKNKTVNKTSYSQPIVRKKIEVNSKAFREYLGEEV